MEQSKVLSALSALAHEARLDLVRLLMPHGDEGLTAGEIARRLGHSASRLSFHLAALEQAGLLHSRKVARNVYYSVDPQGMGGTIAYLMNDCCGEHPRVMACCQRSASPDLPPQDLDRPEVARSDSPAQLPDGIVKT